MEILELELKHYGKFTDHRMSLRPGVNIIYGGNESGKSTLHSFVRAMFFGFGQGRSRAGELSEFRKRQPWESPADFSGSMTVREGEQEYRIERNFDSRAAGLAMWDLVTGQEVADPEQEIARLLGGIGEAAFGNTVFIAQSQAETDELLAAELRQCMVNDGGAGGRTDVSAALQSLRKKKKQAEQKKHREEELLEGQTRKKQTEAEYLRRENEMFRAQLEQLYHPYQQERRYAQEDADEPSDFLKNLLQMLLLLAGLLSLVGAAVLKPLFTRIFLGVFGMLFLALLYPVRRYLLSADDGFEEEYELNGEEREQERRLLAEIAKREDAYRKLQGELEKLYHAQVKQGAVETDIEALNLAIDRICELSDGLFAERGEGVSQMASGILREVTDGRYDRIVMDETGEIHLHTPGRVLGLGQVSSSTLQQIYFAIRVASGELLGKGRHLPLILDEPFAMYDDKRLEAVLRWLKKSGRQVILFTCQRRAREIMDRI